MKDSYGRVLHDLKVLDGLQLRQVLAGERTGKDIKKKDMSSRTTPCIKGLLRAKDEAQKRARCVVVAEDPRQILTSSLGASKEV
eukprot:1159308-Pelagomonas_calceolata.AAC.9